MMKFLNKNTVLIFISTISLSLELRTKFQKVTEQSRKISNVAQFVDKSVEETASKLGITEDEARKRVTEVLKSKNGLDSNNQLLPPISFCSRGVKKSKDKKSCPVKQIIPAHPAGFSTSGNRIPFPFSLTPSDPTCDAIVDTCFPICPACNKCNKFRTIDGTCNNLRTSAPTWTGEPYAKPSPCPRNWGSVNQAFRRHVANTYEDSENIPTGGLFTSYPHPRTVSNAIHIHPVPPEDTTLTHILMQLGQFLDHDISFTPEIDLVKSCCVISHSECFPLHIFASDPFYTDTCKDFVRSAFKCKLSSPVRQQFNGITAYIDGSQIYGSDAILQSHLRTNSEETPLKGKLRVSSIDGEDYLPITSPCGGYGGSGGIGKQFKAGDRRVTENPGLQSLHTIFMREHNRIAGKISDLRPAWDDDRVYEEARRIVIAEWQNVVYGEFLPVILGPTAITHATNSIYDSTEDATIFNVFATAAYRFGHSLIKGTVEKHPTGNYQLKDHFFKIDEIVTGNMEGILRGYTMQNTDSSDEFIDDDVRNELFQNTDTSGTATPGTDLPARNIQRGRDHGIGSYKDYREFCEITTPTNPIGSDIPSWSYLLGVYGGDENNVEIFPAGLSETHHPDALVGPTFRCLLKKQFQSLKDGDRFFFTHKRGLCCETKCNRFTTAQQNVIMQRKLCNIIEDNTGISNLQTDVLKKITTGGSNDIGSCSSSNLDTTAIESLLTPDICVPWACNIQQLTNKKSKKGRLSK